MLEIALLILVAVVLPVVINKTTERGHFRWIVPRLRPIWTAIFVFLSLYALQMQEVLVKLHPRMSGWIGYLTCAFTGASILCGYWWLTGKMLSPTHLAKEQQSQAGSSPELFEQSDAVSKLAELGWTVKPGTVEIEFEVSNRAMPDGEDSAGYFRKLHKPFRLHFQSVKSIAGLHFLSDIETCSKIEISGGEITDIGELRDFRYLKSLTMGQTPINGLTIIDLSPVSSLAELHELNLGGSKVTDLTPISGLTNLRVLNLIDTPVRDLSPISTLVSLEHLDVRGSGVVSLSVLTDMRVLNRLSVDGKQVPSLSRLAKSESLKKLEIIDQNAVDLSPVGKLKHLESLFVWGPPRFNLTPLRALANLQELQIAGLAMGGPSTVTGADSLGELTQLQKLTLGSLAISDLAFVSNLKQLTEINIGRMPISSIAPLRGLKSLKTVSLNLTSVVDISPLLELPALSILGVIRTPARADVLTQLERNGVRIQR